MNRIAFCFVAIGLTDAFHPPSPFYRTKNRLSSRDQVIVSSSAVVERGTATSAKRELLNLLESGEDDNSSRLTPFLEELYQSYAASGIDARVSTEPTYNGDWQNVNLPNFPGGAGFNDLGQPLYTLGRLTFNRIPNGKNVLVASEKMVQRVHPYSGPLPPHVPSSLQNAIQKDPSQLRSFCIDTYFCVESNRNLKGIIRAEGYVYPHPKVANRFESFFVRGRCFSRSPAEYNTEWNNVFRGSIGSSKRRRMQTWLRKTLFRRDTNEQQQVVMVEDKSLSYALNGPVSASAEVVYLDSDFRVTIGQEGSRMINKKN